MLKCCDIHRTITHMNYKNKNSGMDSWYVISIFSNFTFLFHYFFCIKFSSGITTDSFTDQESKDSFLFLLKFFVIFLLLPLRIPEKMPLILVDKMNLSFRRPKATKKKDLFYSWATSTFVALNKSAARSLTFHNIRNLYLSSSRFSKETPPNNSTATTAIDSQRQYQLVTNAQV